MSDARGGLVIKATQIRMTYRRELAEPKPNNYEAIIEGRCPTCDSALERRERDGWCNTCDVGWSYRTTGRDMGELSLTIEPRTVEFTAHFA